MPRRILRGTIVENKNAKTLIVSVTRRYVHSLYKKTVNSSKRYSVHYETGKYEIGDKIEIAESRPYSKTKRFEVLVVNQT